MQSNINNNSILKSSKYNSPEKNKMNSLIQLHEVSKTHTINFIEPFN